MSALRWNTILAVVEALVSAGVLFTLYSVLLTELGAAKLGAWSVLTAATAAAAMADLGVGRAIARFVAKSETQGSGTGTRYVATGLITSCAGSAVTAALAWWPVSILLRGTLPDGLLVEIAPLLPMTLLAFWLSSVASAAAAIMDGFHRSRLRSLAAILANLIYLLASLLLVSPLGVFGLVLALIIREAVRLSALLMIVLRLVPFLSLYKEGWDRATCREMLSYSLGLQMTSVFIFLLEPASRLFLARFGSLEMVAFYEMAWRLVQQARALIVAANQVLVPEFAEAAVSGGERLLSVYRRASELTTLASIFSLGWILATAPFISLIWLGIHQSVFETSLRLVAVGWLANSLATTAYFLGTGSGRLRGVVVSQAAQGGSNLVLGWLLGFMFGGWGVVVATTISLCVGALVVLLDTHFNVVGRRSPLSRVVMLTVCLAVAGLTVLGLIVDLVGDAGLPSQFVAVGSSSAVLGLLLMRHRQELGLGNLSPRWRRGSQIERPPLSSLC